MVGNFDRCGNDWCRNLVSVKIMTRKNQRSHSHHHHTHHDHEHHHHHAPKNFGFAFGMAIFLNSAFVLVEFGYGFTVNSTALIADAGHNLSDVLSLLLAWGASLLAKKAPSKRYTYGLRSSSIFAALANAMFLLVACGAIGWEAAQRFSQTPEIAGDVVMSVASVGILINGISAWLFAKGSKGDLNIRAAYLHMLTDAALSLGVVLAGVGMMFTSWYWLDPSMSLLIVAVILISTWHLLRDSVRLALNAVPENIDAEKIYTYLRQIKGVSDVHDLHIWGMSTTESALTVHLVMPAGYPNDVFIDEITRTLKTDFSIQHSTLQIEQGTTHHHCSLAPLTKIKKY